jgi:hypothetical protein
MIYIVNMICVSVPHEVIIHRESDTTWWPFWRTRWFQVVSICFDLIEKFLYVYLQKMFLFL